MAIKQALALPAPSIAACARKPEATDGAGNTNSSPLFTDAAHANYTLASGSPCIDTNLPGITTDLNGTLRPLDGKNSETARTDIGCYEYVNPAADSDHDGIKDVDELIAGTNPTDSNGC